MFWFLLVRTRGVNNARGSFYYYLFPFTNCLLQPRDVILANMMPSSSRAKIIQDYIATALRTNGACPKTGQPCLVFALDPDTDSMRQRRHQRAPGDSDAYWAAHPPGCTARRSR